MTATIDRPITGRDLAPERDAAIPSAPEREPDWGAARARIEETMTSPEPRPMTPRERAGEIERAYLKDTNLDRLPALVAAKLDELAANADREAIDGYRCRLDVVHEQTHVVGTHGLTQVTAVVELRYRYQWQECMFGDWSSLRRAYREED